MNELILHKLTLFLLIFFIFSSISQSLSPFFQACEPRNCGNLTISYPFYIDTLQKPYCGFPGFMLSCQNNQPLLYLSNDNYTIQNIFYDNQSFVVSNSGFLNFPYDCSFRVHNLTLDPDKFHFAFKYSKLFLFQGCPDEILRENAKFEVKCRGGNANNKSLVVNGEDPDVKRIEGKCREVVSVVYDGGFSANSDFGVVKRGIMINWTANSCNNCRNSGGRCGFDQSASQFWCFCPDRRHSFHCSRKRELKLILGLAIPGGILLLLAAILFWCRKRLSLRSTRFLRRTISSDTAKSDLENDGMYFNVPIFTYKELEEATNKFDSARELGDGGFGTVYYGKLKDGREVAVKRLYERNYKRVEQFMNEVEILTHLRHPNLVSLYGCTSRHCRNLILVYEYVPNGTVSDHLYGDPAQSQVLPWATRLRIAIETAIALSYLHTSGIIHRDVKTNNILLDINFSVKVADFGLSRLFPTDVTHVSTAPQGTPGYLDPEYHQCYQLTDKSDVYSFGVVLIELISSLPAVDINRHRHEINLSNYAMNRIQQSAFEELVDPQLGFKSDYQVQKTTTMVAELAFQCLQNDKDFRPTMDEVVQALKSIKSMDFVVSGDTKNEDVESLKPVLEDTETEDAGSLKNMKKPGSPSSVMDQWTSRNTTPSTSN